MFVKMFVKLLMFPVSKCLLKTHVGLPPAFGKSSSQAPEAT